MQHYCVWQSDTLLVERKITIGSGWLHFHPPPNQGKSFILMKTWIKTQWGIINQFWQRQQWDQLQHPLITDYYNRMILYAKWIMEKDFFHSCLKKMGIANPHQDGFDCIIYNSFIIGWYLPLCLSVFTRDTQSRVSLSPNLDNKVFNLFSWLDAPVH